MRVYVLVGEDNLLMEKIRDFIYLFAVFFLLHFLSNRGYQKKWSCSVNE